jgi:hypothetical protein
MRPGRAETTLQKKATKRKDFGYESNGKKKFARSREEEKREGKEN